MRTRKVPVLVSVLLIALGGCASGDELADGGTKTSDSPTTSDPPEEPADPSTEPTKSPTVAPATGKLIRTGSLMSYRVPAGLDWTFSRGGRTAQYTDGAFNAMIFQFEFETSPPPALDRLARVALKNQSNRNIWARIKRVDNRTVNGVEGYVLEGSGRHPEHGINELKDDLYYEFGASTSDGWVYLQMDFPKDNAKYRRWIESVLASIEWKS